MMFPFPSSVSEKPLFNTAVGLDTSNRDDAEVNFTCFR